MANNEHEDLLNALNEIEDLLKENGLLDDFKPDWAICPDASLEVGCDYVYHLTEEICMRGHVLFNDGVTAILKITNRYEECWFHVLYYQEIKEFFPAFVDLEATRLSEYLCLDVETEDLIFFRDPDDDVIKSWKEDDNGEWKLCAVDLTTFRIGRFKKMLLHELTRIEKEQQEKEQREEENYDTVIRAYLDDTVIQNMYKEYDQDHGNKESDEVLYYSLKRTIDWLNNRNCAIISAWRSSYTRSEKDKRNRELQRTLREYGYGVIRVKGCYAEIGRPIEKENSYLVFDLDDSDGFIDNIYTQSEKYEQDCFLYKPKDEHVAYLIGTNDVYGKGKIDIAGIMRINSEKAENYTEVKSNRISFEKN